MISPEPRKTAPNSLDAVPSPAHERARQRWHIDRIDTEPLTPQQHENARTILAELINTWTHRQSPNSGTTEQRAA